MAVLPNTNLSLSAVRTKLGYTDDWSLFNICTSILINKWSKYKPVRAAGAGETINPRPQGDNGMYGLTINDAWTYNQPRGGSPGGSPDEPGRLGDFRGYEHNQKISYPPVLQREDELSNNPILYPTSTPFIQSFKFRGSESADPSSVLIIPSDIGIEDYYYGIHLHFNGASWWKTFGQVGDLALAGTGFALMAELVVSSGDPHYSNFPSVSTPASGTCDWWLFISSAPSAGSPPGWSNGAPAGLVLLPTGDSGEDVWVNTGDSFEVADYVVVVNDFNLINYGYWGYNQYGIPNQKTGTITAPVVGAPEYHLHSKPDWMTVKVFDGGVDMTSQPNLWISGWELRIYPTAENMGAVRNGTIILHAPSGGIFEIDCWQGPQPGYEGGEPDPHIYVETTDDDGWYITEAAASNTVGSNQLTFSFVPQGGTMPGSTDCDIIVHDVTIDGAVLCTDSGHMRDNYTSPTGGGEGTLTLSRVSVVGDIFHVVITKTV